MAKNVVIISGNIGAGKSTLVGYLKEKGNFLCIPEFVDRTWRDHFYTDRKNYTSYFEKSCLMARIARHLTAKKHKGIVVFDRGLVDAREVFVQNSHDEGFLSFKQLNSYDHDLREALDSLGRTKEEASQWMETLIVYLRTSPKVCFERQNKRKNSKGETGGEIIPLEYFERIHQYYERYISRIEKVYRKWGLPIRPKLLVIDATKDISKHPEYLESIYKKIKIALDIRDTSVQTKLNLPKKVEYIHGSKLPNQNIPQNYRVKNFPKPQSPHQPQQHPHQHSQKPPQQMQRQTLQIKVVRPWHVQRPHPNNFRHNNQPRQNNLYHQNNQSQNQNKNKQQDKPQDKPQMHAKNNTNPFKPHNNNQNNLRDHQNKNQNNHKRNPNNNNRQNQNNQNNQRLKNEFRNKSLH